MGHPHRQHFIVSLQVPESEAENAAYAFSEIGCEGIAEEKASTAQELQLRASFAADTTTRATLAEQIREGLAIFPKLATREFVIEEAPDEDWSERFRQSFTAFTIAPGIVIAPSWEPVQATAGEQVIELDPGMAFGTGLHATTRLCAQELVRLHHELAPGEHTLLDVGTGSGILAMLWRKLRNGRIVAVDNDPDAIDVAQENFEKNRCSGIETGLDLVAIPGTFDIVVANILHNTLVELKEALWKRVTPSGYLILSGITTDQEASILEHFAPCTQLSTITRDGEWSAITLRTRS